MKESFKLHVREKAKEWGCRIEDSMAFYHHYNEYKSYKIAAFFVLGAFGFIILLSLIMA